VPLYEYKCEGCGETFEVIQKFADEPLVVHEKCGGPVHRLMSAPSFQFKGTGWYATDYAKGGTSTPAKPDGGKSESPNKSESSSKTESTPAATEAKSQAPTAGSESSKNS
jgi:putative FmdB family regulatory protein